MALSFHSCNMTCMLRAKYIWVNQRCLCIPLAWYNHARLNHIINIIDQLSQQGENTHIYMYIYIQMHLVQTLFIYTFHMCNIYIVLILPLQSCKISPHLYIYIYNFNSAPSSRHLRYTRSDGTWRTLARPQRSQNGAGQITGSLHGWIEGNWRTPLSLPSRPWRKRSVRILERSPTAGAKTWRVPSQGLDMIWLHLLNHNEKTHWSCHVHVPPQPLILNW